MCCSVSKLQGAQSFHLDGLVSVFTGSGSHILMFSHDKARFLMLAGKDEVPFWSGSGSLLMSFNLLWEIPYALDTGVLYKLFDCLPCVQRLTQDSGFYILWVGRYWNGATHSSASALHLRWLRLFRILRIQQQKSHPLFILQLSIWISVYID